MSDNSTAPQAAEQTENCETATLSFRGKVCLSVSIAIMASGFALLTGLDHVLRPAFKLISDHLTEAFGVLLGVAAIAAYVLAALRFPKLVRIGVHIGLVSGLAFFVYLLSIMPSYGQQPLISIWPLVMLEVGILSFVTCLIRHGNGDREDFGMLLGLCHGIYLFLLFLATAIYSDVAAYKHRDAAANYFGSLHQGQSSVQAQVIEYDGESYECSVVSETARCSRTFQNAKAN